MKVLPAVILTFFFISCSGPDKVNKQVSRIDYERFKSNLVDGNRESWNLLSMIIVQDDSTLFEGYYNGNKPDSINNVQSVTKSIISITLGNMIRNGKLKDKNVPITTFLHPSYTKFKDITFENLLTMSSGIEWYEQEEFRLWILAKNKITYVLQKLVVEKPGLKFNYSSGTAHLTSYLMERALKRSLEEYIIFNIFEPLNIDHYYWPLDEQGYLNGSTRLQLMPADMVKFGKLMLNKGNYNGVQLVDTSWVEHSVKRFHFLSDAWDAIDHVGYGYFWWTGNIGGEEIFFAWGYGGQFIFVIPRLNAVVVTTADWRVSYDSAESTERMILNNLKDEIISMLKINRGETY